MSRLLFKRSSLQRDRTLEMKIIENKYVGKVFKTQKDVCLVSLIKKNPVFFVEKFTWVLALKEKITISFFEKPCVEFFILTGKSRGRIGYENFEDVSSFYEELNS